jgi:two-component system, chemotaxis family, sensor kinase Cph1
MTGETMQKRAKAPETDAQPPCYSPADTGEISLSIDRETETIRQVHPYLERALGFQEGELAGKPLSFLCRQKSGKLADELGTFVSRAAHDMVGPLGQVATLAALLVRRHRSKLDGDALEIVSYIDESVQRMNAVALAIQTYVDLTSREPALQASDANASLKAAIYSLGARITATGASVTYDIMPQVLADPKQLIRLFSILIENSLTFTRPGVPPAIHVGARPRGGQWVFSVTDNGEGIKPELRDIIFVPFKRIHGQEYPGLGMGLAIAQRIVRSHGGEIWLASERETGCEFQFTLNQAFSSQLPAFSSGV